jgi:hypothetical protein
MEEQRNDPAPWRPAPQWVYGEHPGVGRAPKDNTWPGTLMAFGILLLLVSFWSVAQWTLITYLLLSKVFAVLAFAGNLLPYAWSGLRLGMEKLEWFLFNLLAIGPITLSALLAYWIMNGALPEHFPFDPLRPDTAALQRLDQHRGEKALLIMATGCLGFEVIKEVGKVEVTSPPDDSGL